MVFMWSYAVFTFCRIAIRSIAFCKYIYFSKTASVIVSSNNHNIFCVFYCVFFLIWKHCSFVSKERILIKNALYNKKNIKRILNTFYYMRLHKFITVLQNYVNLKLFSITKIANFKRFKTCSKCISQNLHHLNSPIS